MKILFEKIHRIAHYFRTAQYQKMAWEFEYPVIRFMNTLCRKRNETAFKKKQLIKAVKGQRIIVFPPTYDWNMIMHQRPQQMAVAYSKKKHTRVLFLTQNNKWDSVGYSQKISKNLWVINKEYINDVLEALKTAKQVIMSMSWTLDIAYVDIIKPDKLIYEYIDELTLSASYGEKMESDHKKLLEIADVTVCTAEKLYCNAKQYAKNAILSTNAGDYSFFSKTRRFRISELIRDRIKHYECVIGYYGALAKWFDYELIKNVASVHKNWVFIIIGIDYDGTLGNSGITELENVIVIPPQKYEDLPAFLKAFDIACIPFIINDITLSTSPVKMYEYMAAGKPILTSELPECVKFKSVRTYKNAEEFAQQVIGLMHMKKDDAYRKILKKDAADNTWDERTDSILNAIK